MNGRSVGAVVEAIWALEDRFPVDEWVVDGLHVWPIVRYHLYNQGYRLRPDVATTRDGILRRAGRRMRGVVSELGSVGRLALALQPADVLFVSDGVSFVRTPVGLVDRYAYPFVEMSTELGLSVAVVQPSASSSFTGRQSKSQSLGGLVGWAEAIGAIRGRLVDARVRLPGFEAAMAIFQRVVGVSPPNTRDIVLSSVAVEAISAVMLRVLDYVGPKLVPVVCYYGAPQYAMMLACKRRGVKSMDVQHGLNGEYHWAYSRWSRVPSGGYEVLPDVFWCWRQEDVSAVRAWSTKCATKAVLGGDPIVRWFASESQNSFVDETALARLKVLAKGRRLILLTLNGYESQETLRQYVGVSKDLSDEFFFLFRVHPVRLGQKEVVRKLLKDDDGAELDLASDLPIWTLLRIVAVHVTEVSSSVLDALSFGVPSVILGRTDLDLFRAEIESGWAVAVGSSEELRDAMLKQLNRVSLLRRPELPDSRAVLEAVIADS